MLAYGTILTLSLCLAFALLVRLRAWRTPELFLLACLPLTCVAVGGRLGQTILDAGNFDWAGARLAPLIALKFGHPLYYPPNNGPVFNTIYAPLSYVIYAPALLAEAATPAIMIGSAIGLIAFFLPAFLVLRQAGQQQPIYALIGCILFALLAYQLPSLRMSIEGTIHDSPALGFACLACLFLYGEYGRSVRWLLLSSLCAVLAVWSKQVMAPLLLSLPLWTLASQGVRRFALHTALVMLAGIVVSSPIVMMVGWRDMVFNVWTLPARHPWNGQLPVNLAAIGFYFYRETFILLAGVALIGLFEFRQQARERNARWALFIWVAVCNAPTAFLGRIKVGGSANSFSPTVYFLVLGLLCYAVRLTWDERYAESIRTGVRLTWSVVAGAFVLLCAVQPLFFFKDYEGLSATREHQVSAYLQRHPGVAYFPWNSLSHLYVDGKLCHFAYGLFDREIGGFPLSDEHFLSHVPAECRYVCFPAGRRQHRPPQCLDRFLADFPHRVELAELPGFECYARAVSSFDPRLEMVSGQVDD